MIVASEVESMGRILAGIGIVVNLFSPGLGSLIMGKWSTGAIQLGLMLIVFLVKFVTFGLLGFLVWPIGGAVWVWALVGGVMTYIERSNHEALNPRRF